MKNKNDVMMVQKRHQKEAKELVRLEKEEKKSAKMLKYFIVLVIILTIVYVADELASNVGNTMKPYMIFHFFNIFEKVGFDYNTAIKSQEYSDAVSKFNVVAIPTYIITLLLPLYKMLPDRFGRKPFLVINTLGMALGMAICMLCSGYVGFLIGTMIVGFFTPNDIQVIYIMEVAPQKKRATLCSITKGIALLSVSLIGVLKNAFYTVDNPSSWRLVFLIPVIIAAIIGISCLLLTAETPAYIKQRKEFLLKSDEQREQEAKERKEKANSEKTGIIPAAKYIGKSRQLKAILISLIIFEFAVGIKGYENETLGAFGQSDTDISLFYIIEPIVYAICAFFSGFLTDKVGRKNSCLIFGAVACIAQALFVLLARAHVNIVVLSILNGLMYGGLWSFSDCMFFVLPAESCPTKIRASVTGLITYAGGISILTGMVIGILFNKIGASNIGLLQLFTFVPFIAVAVIILMIFVKETKDVDVQNIQ